MLNSAPKNKYCVTMVTDKQIYVSIFQIQICFP